MKNTKSNQTKRDLFPFGKDAAGRRVKLRDYLSQKASEEYEVKMRKIYPFGLHPKTGFPLTEEQARDLEAQEAARKKAALEAKAEQERKSAPFGRKKDGTPYRAHEYIMSLSQKNPKPNQAPGKAVVASGSAAKKSAIKAPAKKASTAKIECVKIEPISMKGFDKEPQKPIRFRKYAPKQIALRAIRSIKRAFI